MSRRTLNIIVSVILVFLLPAYWFVQWTNSVGDGPVSEAGLMNLKEWDFARNGPVRLVGEWEFYRNQLLGPESFRDDRPSGVPKPELAEIVRVPGKWNSYIGDEHEGSKATGFGTYRLRIQLNGDQEGEYGVHTVNIRNANKIYLNGREIGSSGVPGASAAEGKQKNVPYVGFSFIGGDSAELIVQVANYSYASGGIIYPMVFGDPSGILNDRDRSVFADLTIAIGFFLLALYLLMLHRGRKQESALLFLGLFCLSSLVYVLTHGEKLIDSLFPLLPHEWLLKLQLISSAMTYYFLLYYVAVTVPRPSHKIALLVSNVVTAVTVLIAVFLPPLQFSSFTDIPVTLVSFSNVIYVSYTILDGLKRRSEERFLLLISVQSILVFILVLLLNAGGLLEIPLLLPYEMLVFVITQALLLANRFTDSYRKAERLSKQLLTLDGLKDEFMANTSHELRTPLHGMINIAQSLLEGVAGKLDAKQLHDLSLVVTTGKRLSSLINDILDFSKMKNGDLKLQLKAVDLSAVAQSALEVVAQLRGSKAIRFIRQWPDSLPYLDTDEDRLHQVLLNLLGNAVKFTKQGEVGIKAAVVGEFMQITVWDTGIGIAKDRFDSIFRSFEQIDDNERHKIASGYSGSGLGLSVTKKLVELCGGNIWVESELGSGSAFHFTLPIVAAQPRTPGISAEPWSTGLVLDDSAEVPAGPDPYSDSGGTNGHTILIVDDDPVNLQVLIKLLSPENYLIIATESGEAAWEELMRNPRIDLVIADWMMPGWSGLDLTRRIRTRYLLSELPVLLLTARGRPEYIETAFQAGINDFLGKPVDAGELRARVHTLIELRKSVQTTLRSEMAFLQAQIKPHFLYNALNTIIALCPIDPDKAARLLTELSEYLRGSFDFQNREQLVPLRKEMDLVKSYIFLEKARFDERLQVEYEVDVDLQRLVPPLSIQPIVENAVRHGVTQRVAGGTVRIAVKETADGFAVTVSDDGVGIRPERLAEMISDKPGGRSVGLLNIHRRLLTLYGTGLQIESKWNIGTTVGFNVPRSDAPRNGPHNRRE